MGILEIIKDLKGQDTKHHRNIIVLFVDSDDSIGEVNTKKFSIPYGHNYDNNEIYDKVDQELNYYRRDNSLEVLQIICCDGFNLYGDKFFHIIYLNDKISKAVYDYE